MLELLFDDNGHLLRTTNQFAVGDAKAYAARIAASTPAPQPAGR
jgi:hypothetical protein